MVSPQAHLLARDILDALPQTQCQRCAYPDCAAYAQAIASAGAAINRCPPGGAEGVARLAAITRQPVLPLDPSCGNEGPMTVAVIDEDWCIGCTLCLKVCPTDAILGGNKRMHTVIAPYCTGCDLCIPVCPVDCIHMEPVGDPSGPARTGWAAWTPEQAATARQRYDFHQKRQQREARENDERLAAKARTKLADLAAHSQLTDPTLLERKRALIEAALAAAAQRADTAQQTPGKDAPHQPQPQARA